MVMEDKFRQQAAEKDKFKLLFLLTNKNGNDKVKTVFLVLMMLASLCLTVYCFVFQDIITTLACLMLTQFLIGWLVDRRWGLDRFINVPLPFRIFEIWLMPFAIHRRKSDYNVYVNRFVHLLSSLLREEQNPMLRSKANEILEVKNVDLEVVQSLLLLFNLDNERESQFLLYLGYDFEFKLTTKPIF